MVNKINVSEVSEVLRKQLAGMAADPKFDEIGTVLQVGDGVIRLYGL